MEKDFRSIVSECMSFLKRNKKNKILWVVVVIVVLCGMAKCGGESDYYKEKTAGIEKRAGKSQANKLEAAKKRLLDDYIKFVEKSGVPVPLETLREQIGPLLDNVIESGRNNNLTDQQIIAMMEKVLEDSKAQIISISLGM